MCAIQMIASQPGCAASQLLAFPFLALSDNMEDKTFCPKDLRAGSFM